MSVDLADCIRGDLKSQVFGDERQTRGRHVLDLTINLGAVGLQNCDGIAWLDHRTDRVNRLGGSRLLAIWYERLGSRPSRDKQRHSQSGGSNKSREVSKRH